MSTSLNKLQQIIAVARCRSFSRAAEELHMSQPALSRSIAAAEARYGFPLFNRMSHGVEVTSAGQDVVEQAQALVQELQVFDSNLRLIGQGKGGRLSVGFAPLLASQLLTRFAADFLRPDSAAQIRVMIRPGRGLLDALKNDEIEVFFFPESHIQDAEDIEIGLVGQVMSGCFVRAGHPLLERRQIARDDLVRYPWLSSVEPHLAPDVPSKARLICDNYHILRETVMTTDAVCICSTDFVAMQLADGSLKEIRVEGLPLGDTRIYMAKLRRRLNSPLASEAISAVRRYLAAGRGGEHLSQ
ncbi:LysR family transcriptional regulator [Novosphingobium sp. RD2P27]|uniref:LysR family transcriptional regulator n=1 Tax=Novosphingobium kalidii TaxID=3230299 RepID=A0ABV2D3H6_9SPHN